ncbi:hypothetical protein AGMMS50262_16090 [Bacteroidia bacterium]|nr:hypothetical protein AGMMS50262_16090 [Bacteroidia bacterium]
MGKNTQIAKNTLILYVRLFISMLISLYTSRILLNVLGIDDVGIYNAVGGVVMMMDFFNSTLLTATQRFLNYEIGAGNERQLPEVFSTARIGHCIIALAVLILGETVGLWFVGQHMVIPAGRLTAALWVYHCSLLIFVLHILITPYQAVLVARERLNIYAFLSLLDVILKFIIACALSYLTFDKLQSYGILLLLSAIIVRLGYPLYGRRVFHECRAGWIWNKQLAKKMFRFSGWMLLGISSDTVSAQGITIAVNLFFGLVYNTARGITQQISIVLQNIGANLMLAVQPQIVQSYSRGERNYMYKLVYLSSKMSFFFLFLIALPLLLKTEYILTLWLKIFPEQTVIFVRLALIDVLLSTFFAPLSAISQASGKLKRYQLIMATKSLLLLAGTVLFYHWGFPAYITYILAICLTLAGLLARLVEMHISLRFMSGEYLTHVSLRLFLVVSVSIIAPVLYAVNQTSTWLHLIGLLAISTISITVMFWFLGLTGSEKGFVIKEVKRKFRIKSC